MESGTTLRSQPTSLRIGGLILYWVLLVLLLHWPLNLKPPHHWLSADKFVHVALYGVLAIFLVMVIDPLCAVHRSAYSAFTRCGLVLLLVAIQGMVDEITQPLTGRSFDMIDWAFDLLGAVLALLIYRAMERHVSRFRAVDG